MSRPALVKTMFDQAIQNQGEPLRLLDDLRTSMQELKDEFNLAMRERGNWTRLFLHGDADGAFLNLVYMPPEEFEETLLRFELEYNRERQTFEINCDTDPEGRLAAEQGISVPLVQESISADEAGIQRISVMCSQALLNACSDRVWKNYMDYLDRKTGQMALQF